MPADPSADAQPIASGTSLAGVAQAIVRFRDPPKPNDVEAEVSLIASLLWNGTYNGELTLANVVDILDREDVFSIPSFVVMWKAMVALYTRGEATDAVSVHSEIKKLGERERVHLATIEELVEVAAPTSAPKLRAHAQSIRDAWIRRELLQVTKKITIAANTPESSPTECMQIAHELVGSVASLVTTADSSFVTAKDASKRLVRKIVAGAAKGMPTGIAAWDEASGGLFRKEVTIIAARTSVGKSALANQVAEYMADHNDGDGVVIASMEMNAESLIQRIAAAGAGIDGSRVRHGNMSQTDISALFGKIQEIATKPLFFLESLTQTMLSIDAAVGKTAKKLALKGKRLALVVVDHLGLVRPASSNGGRMTEEQKVSEASKYLRTIASKYDCHVMGIAQINREGAKRVAGGKDAIPQLHEIRGSGSIEDDADQVVIIHRPSDGNNIFIPDVPAILAIAKARNDKRGILKQRFEEQHTRFRPWTEW